MEIKTIKKEKTFEPIELIIKIESLREFQLIKHFGQLSMPDTAKIANNSSVNNRITNFRSDDEEIENFMKVYEALDEL